MIIVFDLDDTLYDEMTFVMSGFREVARFLEKEKGLSYEDVYPSLQHFLQLNGRGSVFDDTLSKFNLFTKSLKNKCLSVYRHHNPSIFLYPEGDACLKRFKKHKMYIVTDGNKMVQHNKLKALNLYNRVNGCLVTHRFGLKHAKPSPYCFYLICQRENVAPEEVVYVADNPAKDFVGIKPLGFRTVRVLTGGHREVKADSKHEADYIIKNLDELTWNKGTGPLFHLSQSDNIP